MTANGAEGIGSGSAESSSSHEQPPRQQLEWTNSPEVKINVYDLGQSRLVSHVNAAFRRVALFHTGVEVYGVEWHFGFCWDPQSPGVTSVPPMKNAEHTYRETIHMGSTNLPRGEVKEMLIALRKTWLGRSYDVLRKNCNHFTDTFCQLLGCGPAPMWIAGILATESAPARPPDPRLLVADREAAQSESPSHMSARCQPPVEKARGDRSIGRCRLLGGSQDGEAAEVPGVTGVMAGVLSDMVDLARRPLLFFDSCQPELRCRPKSLASPLSEIRVQADKYLAGCGSQAHSILKEGMDAPGSAEAPERGALARGALWRKSPSGLMSTTVPRKPDVPDEPDLEDFPEPPEVDLLQGLAKTWLRALYGRVVEAVAAAEAVQARQPPSPNPGKEISRWKAQLMTALEKVDERSPHDAGPRL